MKTIRSFKLFKGWLVIAAVGMLAAGSARAVIYVNFDLGLSDIGAGSYAFDLGGVATSPTPTYNSQFTLYNFSTIGNVLNPVVATAEPSGWSLNGPNDVNSVRWYFHYQSYPTIPGGVDGTFIVQATPNLLGTINWQYAAPGQPSGSGTVTIAAVPEPASAGLLLLGLVALVGVRRFANSPA
jgi:hypothetical protein